VARHCAIAQTAHAETHKDDRQRQQRAVNGPGHQGIDYEGNENAKNHQIEMHILVHFDRLTSIPS